MNSKNIKSALLDADLSANEKLEFLYGEWRKSDEQTSFYDLLISASKDADIASIAADSVENGYNAFHVLTLFRDCFHRLNHNVTSVIKLYEVLFEKTKGDLTSHILFDFSKSIAEESPSFARCLLGELMAVNEAYVFDHIHQIVQGLPNENMYSVYEYAYQNLMNGRTTYIPYYLQILSQIAQNSWKDNDVSNKTLEILNILEKRDNDESYIALVFGYIRLKLVIKDASQRVLSIASMHRPNTADAIARYLLQTLSESISDPLYPAILTELSKFSADNNGAVEIIDLILVQLSKKRGAEDLASHFLLSWLEHSNYNLSKRSIRKVFDSYYYDLCKSPDEFNRLVTNLFNSDSLSHHAAAASLCRNLNDVQKKVVKLDKDILKKLSKEDHLFIIRKVMAYIFEPETLCVLMMSIYDAAPRNKHMQGYFLQCFQNIIGKEYLSYVTEYLSECRAKTKSKIKIQLCQQVIESLNLRLQAFEKLSYRKELNPSSVEGRLINLETHRLTQKAYNDARMGSPLLSIVSQVPIKYGVGTFFMQDGQPREKSYMHSVSHSMTLPFSERSSPVEAEYERYGFRIAKRGD